MLSLYLFLALTTLDMPITISDPIFQITDGEANSDGFVLLDTTGTAIAKYDWNGKLIASVKAKGQGPGEFNTPRCIAIGDNKVFVGDFYKINVFDSKLKFLFSFPCPNNAQDMHWINNQLYVSTTTYPTKTTALRIFNGKGKQVKEFYEDKSTNDLSMPYFCVLTPEQLLVQPKTGFTLESVQLASLKVMALKVARPVNFLDFVPAEPFIKKYGATRAAYLRWKTQWMEPIGVVSILGRYTFLSYEQLDEDLVTKQYFIVAYDHQEAKLITPLMPSPGRMLMGFKDKVYFSEEAQLSGGDYELHVQGYPLSHFQN